MSDADHTTPATPAPGAAPAAEPRAGEPAPVEQGSFLSRLINPRNQGLLVTMISSLAAVVVAFVICGFIIWATGKNPFTAYQKMFSLGFTGDKLKETLDRSTPLILSAVAVAIGFKMNMFNIGVEGQYLIAMLVGAVVGARVHTFSVLHVTVILVAAMATGAIYAGLAAVLKVTRGVNEVISTIMLNAIAISVVAWLFERFFRDAKGNDLNVKTKPIPSTGWMPDLADGLNSFLLIALAVLVLYWLVVFKSRFGFRLRASGANPVAARTSGISSNRMIVIAMLMSGGAAGLVGMKYTLGELHAYGQGRPEGLGFAGIAVALLGRNHPAGILPAALLFGFLDATAAGLELRGVPRSVSEVIQAVILLSVVIINEVVGRWYSHRTVARTAAALELQGVAA